MHIQLNGLVIKEENIGESNKIVTFLTDQRGIIRAFVKGARSTKGKNSCASQLFSYSELLLYSGRGGYTLNEAEIKESFLGLREDMCKLALAQYFCEVMLCMAPKEEKSLDYLRIILNSLSYLENDKRKKEIIKSVMEMRVCVMSGYMPDLVACRSCGIYNPGDMYFSICNSFLMCKSCLNGKYKGYYYLKSGVSEALRHIVYSPMERLFLFQISDNALVDLSNITEKYLIQNSYTEFNALNFYKMVYN